MQDSDEHNTVRPGGNFHFDFSWQLKSMEEANARMMRPMLLEGLQGDESARQGYRSHRILSLHLLPEWCQKHVAKICRDAYEHVKSDELLELVINLAARQTHATSEQMRLLDTSDIARKFRLPPFQDPFVKYLNLDGMMTYEGGQQTLRRIDALRLDDARLIDVVDGSRSVSMGEFMLFRPTVEGPVGRAARLAMRASIEFMFRARVAIDHLSANHVAVWDAPLETLLVGADSPWKIASSRSTQNIIEMQDMFDNELHFLTREQRREYMTKFLRASDPVRRLYEIYFPKELEEFLSQDRKQAISVKREESAQQDFEDGVSEAIHQRFGRMPKAERGSMTRRLCALHRRGACSYSEVVGAIMDGQDMQEMLDTYYMRIRRQDREKASSQTLSPISDDHRTTGIEELRVQLTYLQRDGKVPFAEWINTLDDVTRERIEARLARFEEGNPGDFKALRRGLGNIWEARLAFGPHYRIYIKRSAPGHFLIISGGTKATQEQDIRRAVSLAD